MDTSLHADRVIVGAGPIGCWTALQMKKRNPDMRITVYERRAVYQRDHILSIDKASFLQWSKTAEDDGRFLKAVYDAQATCSIAWGLNGVPGAASDKPSIDLTNVSANRVSYWLHLPKILDIRAVDFEEILKKECEAAGVNFVYKGIDDPDEVMALHPECTNFIAADGANSKMREAIWGPRKECLFERDIYPSLDFNYVSHGQASYLRINTFDKLGHVYAENIGLAENGKTGINQRIVVSKEEYNALPAADFKKPLIVTPDSSFWDNMPVSKIYGRTLKQDFYDLLSLRAQHANENITDDPVKMTKIYLSQYFAKKFAKTVEYNGQKKNWFLAGDSAMGMPFYRSVNSGLILGAQLAYLLTMNVREAAKPMIYNYYTEPFRITREFARIAKTEAKIMMYKNVWRPAFYHIAQTPLAPIVKVPTDYALKTLKLGKTS